jgi:O-antigen/teichoic acid export membrane protein
MLANAGAVFASRIVVAVFGWAGTILIIRELDKKEWGQFSFVFFFLALVSVLSNVVNSRVAIHGLLKEDADRFAGSFLLLRGLLGLFAYCVAMSIVVLAGYPDVVVRATAVAGLVIVFATPSGAYDAVFQARMRMDRTAIAAVVGQIAQFVLTAALALMGTSLVIFTIPAVLCEIVALTLKIRWTRKLQRIRYVPDTHRWWRMLREAIPLAIGGGLASAYYSIDAVMLSKMDTFQAVGAYGIAYKFAGILSFLPLAMNAAVLTLLATSWPNHLTRFRHALQRAGTTLYLAGVIVTVEFLLFAEDAIRLLYGDAYAGSDDATRLVVAGECVGFFTTLGVTTFAAMSRNRLYPVAALAGLVFNVGANLYLIPEFSFRGAAWATLATELIVATILWVPLIRELGVGPFAPSVLVKGLVAGVISGALGWFGAMGLPWVVAAVLVAILFIALLQVGYTPDRGGLASLWREEVPPAIGAPGGLSVNP